MITRAQLRAWGACDSAERIADLVPEEGLTPLEVCDLPIHHSDRLSVLLRQQVLGASFGGVLANLVERALNRTHLTDPRSRNVVAALREGRVPDVAAANAAFARQTRAAAKAAAEAAAEAAAAEAEAPEESWLSRAAYAAARAEEAAAWAAEEAAKRKAARTAITARWKERYTQLADVRRALVMVHTHHFSLDP